MAHKRLRDWPVMCFSYWLKPEGELPQAVWDEAKRMNKLWNHLVAEGKKLQKAYQELYKDIPVIAELNEQLDQAKQKCEEADQALNEAKIKFRTKKGPELAPYLAEKKATAQAKKEISQKRTKAKAEVKDSEEWKKKEADLQEIRDKQNALYKEAYRLFRGEGCHYHNIEAVTESYRNALSRAFKTKHWPKFHRFDGNFSFTHRFLEGGSSVEKIFSGTRVLSIEPIPTRALDPTLPQRERKRLARSKIRFLIGGENVVFKTILHRPLPEGSIVKKAMVVRRTSGLHDTWSLSITVEIPPVSIQVINTGERKKAAAIDLGYRVIDGNIRIGVLVDTDNRVEQLILPTKSLHDKFGKHSDKTVSFIDINQYRKDLESRQDQELEIVKEVAKKALAELVDKMPEEYRDLLVNWHTAREGRLYKTIRMLKESNLDNDLLERLNVWRHHHNKIQSRINGTRARMLRHRRHFYQNLAMRLCKEYETIVLEKLNLSKMARKEKPDGNVPDLPEKTKDYRTIAALSEFIAALKLMAPKTKTAIVEDDPKNTTRECSFCGYINSPDNPQKLVWICGGCGATWDQDEDAGRVLLKRHFGVQEGSGVC